MKGIAALAALFFAACVSPYSPAIRQVKREYKAGIISRTDYTRIISELYSLDEDYKREHDYSAAFAPPPRSGVIVNQHVTSYPQHVYPTTINVNRGGLRNVMPPAMPYYYR